MPFTISEQRLFDSIHAELEALDRYARVPLSARLRAILDRYGDVRALTVQTDAHLVELALELDDAVRAPDGSPFPELRLVYRKRSSSIVTRAARQILGALPPARILVLTPIGYRITQRRHLEGKRFLANGRPRLARYRASSVTNLSTFLDLYAGLLAGG